MQRLFSIYGGDTYIASTFSVPSGFPEGKNLSHRLGASIVRNSKTGKTYVKLVNALPCPLQLTVNGLSIPATAKTEGFEGSPEEQQLNIKTGEAGSGTILLPPYSFRAIEINNQ